MAKNTVILSGLSEVMENLRMEAGKIKNGTMRGLILSAIEIRRDMEKTEPKIPIDTGNLRASFFTVTSNGKGQKKPSQAFKGNKSGEMASHHDMVVAEKQADAKTRTEPTLIMGFSASYGVWVHEDMEKKFKRPGSGPKFFEYAVNRNSKKVLQILLDNVKID